MSDFRFIIDVPVKNQWESVELLRSSVQNCFAAVFRRIEGADALAMVTGELLENAIKHGHWTGEDGIFRLRVWGDSSSGNVSVTNPVRAGEHPEKLYETLRWIDGFANAADAYRARLVEVARPGQPGGGLGLVRIAYEGGCRIKAEIEGSTLCVTARRGA